MKRTAIFWLIAFLVTATTAYYQRATGPTYPFSGETQLSDKRISYRMPRSHGGEGNVVVTIQTGDSTVLGFVEWKRHKTGDSWTRVNMPYEGGVLSASLPHQLPAGKLEYRIALSQGDRVAIIPAEESLVIRFKGDVPLLVLLPHVIAMFCSMLLAARTGLEFFNKGTQLKKLTYWTIGFLVAGGFVLGPIVQKFAFGAWWTGWPFGYDLTDNKTALALLAWIGVAIAIRKSIRPKTWALAASIVTFVVFLIPHSVLGSEIDYKTHNPESVISDTIKRR